MKKRKDNLIDIMYRQKLLKISWNTIEIMYHITRFHIILIKHSFIIHDADLTILNIEKSVWSIFHKNSHKYCAKRCIIKRGEFYETCARRREKMWNPSQQNISKDPNKGHYKDDISCITRDFRFYWTQMEMTQQENNKELLSKHLKRMIRLRLGYAAVVFIQLFHELSGEQICIFSFYLQAWLFIVLYLFMP